MAEETTQFILGDAALDGLNQPPKRRRFFRRKKKDSPPLTHCENCGAALTGEYCAQCGQHAIDYRRSLLRVVLDAADSFLNLETKFLKTLGVLLTRPGRLTNDFNAGRRVRYVHPLRLYLLASIAFFLLARLVHLAPSGPSDLTPEARAAPSETPAAEGGNATPAPPKVNPVIQFDSDMERKSVFGSWLEERVKKKIGEDGTNAQLFLETLRSHVPAMMLCCIPLFAFVLKVLYLRQRRFYVEHLVYALHIHTFAYVAVVVITLLGMGAERWLPSVQVLLVVVLFFIVAAQVFLSIRRVYRQGWFMSTFKFLLGGITYLLVLALALGATAFVTLLLP